jgi:hypothetical protein
VPTRTLTALVLAAVLTAACSSPSPVSPARAPAPKTITVRVAGGVISPPPGRVPVPVHTRVHLAVDSDSPDTAHVHGYDLEFPVGPGLPGVADFTADVTGVFDVELHGADRRLTELAVS